MTKGIFKMKKLLILGVFLLFTACAPCPNQDVILFVATPFGPMAVKVERGTLDKKNRGQDWITLQEWNKQYDVQELEKEEKFLPECS